MTLQEDWFDDIPSEQDDYSGYDNPWSAWDDDYEHEEEDDDDGT